MTFAAAAENPKWGVYAPLFGMDIHGTAPGSTVVMANEDVRGYPFRNFSEIPPGAYWVQAVLNVYTRFERSDGHTIWAAMDHWDAFNSAGGHWAEGRQWFQGGEYLPFAQTRRMIEHLRALAADDRLFCLVQSYYPPHDPYTDLLLSSVPEMDPDWLDELLADRAARKARGEKVMESADQ